MERLHPRKCDTEPFSFGLVLLPKFSALTLSSLVDPLRIANYCDGRKLYDWQYLSANGEDVPSSGDFSISTQMISSDERTWDVIIVCGGWNAERYDDARLLNWLRQQGRRGVTLGAAETGSYVLARAGLLAGCSATIHWYCHHAFAERYPETELRKQLYVIDHNRMTCAGGTACLDMILHTIRNHHGRVLAAEVADQLLYSPVRAADHVQKQSQDPEQTALPQVLRKAVEIMEAHVEHAIKIPELAKSLALSQRKLERLFNRHFGCSAVAFYRKVRLQQARVLLTHTDMSVLDICVACGFASSSYFSKSYTEQFGVRPRDHRLAWPDSDRSPIWPGLHEAVSSR